MKTLLTRYSKTLDQCILLEYPRPQLRRNSYLNLNGYWDFDITKNDEPKSYSKQIRVPFSPESILSEVNQILQGDEYAFYRKTVVLPDGFLKNRLILHFGAVDQTAWIYINDQLVLTHIGGYVPFSIDISEHVVGSSFEIKVKVQDLSDTSYHLTGKQRIDHGGIFYTPQSGIWQTVWLESVPNVYIEDLKLTPNFDDQSVDIEIASNNQALLKVSVFFKGTLLNTLETPLKSIIVPVIEFHPWSPEEPNLYDLTIEYGEDVIQSYVGLRQYQRKADAKGIMRFYLNGKPYFQSGVLDQGYYSDGLLTPPSDQAMIDDIMTMKNLGFNMLRKHIKMEPLRWYYHCDRLGMLVWQDMMSGTESKDVVFHHILSIAHIHLPDTMFLKKFGKRNPIGKELYEKDLVTMIETLKNVTSICTWVPFNEAWGQFDTKRICQKVEALDQTRLVDHASGWSDQGVGDFHSRHIYYQKIKFYRPNAKKRILALTEFGGYSLPIDHHRYNETSVFGYKTFSQVSDLEAALKVLYIDKLKKGIEKGLSVLIYTQLSDVEDEVNGFLTYDREVLKVNPTVMLTIHQYIYDLFKKNS